MQEAIRSLDTHNKTSQKTLDSLIYLESTSDTQYLELSTTTMVSWYKVEDDERYLKNLTQHRYKLLQHQHSRKFFIRLNQGDIVFVNEENSHGFS